MMHWSPLLLLILLLIGCGQPMPEPDEFQVTDALGDGDLEGFARATQVRPFSFPQDHGPHPAYRNEWWYITGNLRGEDGRAFGFQVTFFRIALQPESIDSPSAWRTHQIWMAHAALSDLSAGQHLADERFARQGIGLAGATALPFKVWLEDWQLREDEGEQNWRLRLPAEGFDLTLELAPISPIILQGNAGLSQKSAEPGNASYYYSIPRLRAHGSLKIQGESLPVSGLAWFDREWSTSVLGPDQTGWDWFSLHLQDGRNLMYYQLRRKDGATDSHSAGSVSDSEGVRIHLDSSLVTLTPLKYWGSDARRYPIEWQLRLQDEAHPWRIRALLADQEMHLSVRYWEGAVEVSDEVNGAVLGRGYLEMAGYE